MARRLLLRQSVGEKLLTSKLQILNANGNRRPSIALSILTGRVAEQLSILENFYADDPVIAPAAVTPIVEPVPIRRQFAAHTVYLSEAHLRDIDAIIKVLSSQQDEPRRLTRSAVLRRAIEHLREVVEADPANSSLENE